uniref:Uncharacterized protein n=1 Tax=Rhipicephalus zambeziensis TaxID=60191 RepID=A0A224YHF6_9ACAR
MYKGCSIEKVRNDTVCTNKHFIQCIHYMLDHHGPIDGTGRRIPCSQNSRGRDETQSSSASSSSSSELKRFSFRCSFTAPNT